MINCASESRQLTLRLWKLLASTKPYNQFAPQPMRVEPLRVTASGSDYRAINTGSRHDRSA